MSPTESPRPNAEAPKDRLPARQSWLRRLIVDMAFVTKRDKKWWLLPLVLLLLALAALLAFAATAGPLAPFIYPFL